MDADQAAITLVGAAAAARSAGQPASDALLTQAQAVDSRFPTYYGSAWIGLGRVELTTSLLGGCA
jgi:endoglucanase